MKPLILTLLLCICLSGIKAQKYALIDQTLTKPLQYTDQLAQRDISNQWFPIEKEKLPEFRAALWKIYKQLKKNNGTSESLSFNLGCLSIKGTTVMVMNERRHSYLMSFQCDHINATYLLCDPKLRNTTNAFIVKTWIRYVSP